MKKLSQRERGCLSSATVQSIILMAAVSVMVATTVSLADDRSDRNAGGSSESSFLSPRYAVIDLGSTNTGIPVKITDSNYVLISATINYVASGSPDVTYARVWSNGTNLTLQPADPSTPKWNPTDIAQDGTIVGIEWAPSPLISSPPSPIRAYTIPPVPLYGNLPNLAVWSAGNAVPILTQPPIQYGDAAYMDLGYENSALGDTSYDENIGPSISPQSIWTTQVVGSGAEPDSTIDGLSAARTSSGGVSATQVRLGTIAATFDADGDFSTYTGTAVFPLAANNADQCLEEKDSGYTLITSRYPGIDFVPSTSIYTVGNTTLPSGFQPVEGKGALSNTNSLANYYVLGSDSTFNADNFPYPNSPTKYECWDGTHMITLPQLTTNTPPSITPVGINAMTASLSTGTNTPPQTVAATQIIGSQYVYSPVVQTTGYIWNMIASTNATPAFVSPQLLDSLVPGYGTTNASWSGIVPASINDAGAIVGTATYSGTNPNIAAGSHGVLLAPAYEIQVDGFIPQEYVPDPANPGSGGGPNPDLANNFFFAGDMRKTPLDGIFTTGTATFNKYAGYTARQKVMATVYAELDPSGSQEQEESNNNPTSIIHLTKEYNGTQFSYVPGAGISPLLGTGHILPNAVPINSGTATPQTATVTVTHPASRVVQAEFQCTVSDPLVWGSSVAPLYYDIIVKIDATNPAQPTYTLSGNHKLFPAYEVYINKQLVHDYSPISGGYTPNELLFPDATAPSLSASSITSGCATMPGLTGNINNQP